MFSVYNTPEKFENATWICVWGGLGRENHVITVTSSFSKSSVFKIFSVHTKMQNHRFQVPPVWRAFFEKLPFRSVEIKLSFKFLRLCVLYRPYISQYSKPDCSVGEFHRWEERLDIAKNLHDVLVKDIILEDTDLFSIEQCATLQTIFSGSIPWGPWSVRCCSSCCRNQRLSIERTHSGGLEASQVSCTVSSWKFKFSLLRAIHLLQLSHENLGVGLQWKLKLCLLCAIHLL